MRKIIFLVTGIILLFISCKKKETNEIYLCLDNKTTDTIRVQFYYTSGSITKDEIIFPSDSIIYFFNDAFVSTPNEVMLANIKKVNLIFPDTFYSITMETDTTNNMFNNNRWLFMGKEIYYHTTNFTKSEVNAYNYKFNLYRK